ncbi:unnamed protein product, partial [Ectocarpus sp. 12 AP-2014]
RGQRSEEYQRIFRRPVCGALPDEAQQHQGCPCRARRRRKNEVMTGVRACVLCCGCLATCGVFVSLGSLVSIASTSGMKTSANTLSTDRKGAGVGQHGSVLLGRDGSMYMSLST